MDDLTPAHWTMLSNVSKALVSFDERYEQPETEFELLDRLEALKLVQSHNSDTHGYILYYTLTEQGKTALAQYKDQD